MQAFIGFHLLAPIFAKTETSSKRIRLNDLPVEVQCSNIPLINIFFYSYFVQMESTSIHSLGMSNAGTQESIHGTYQPTIAVAYEPSENVETFG